MSLAVDNPAIQDVLDLQTGQHHPVTKVISSDYAEVVQLRMALRVGSRTIGYLKTSVRCCMAERYFEKFWQHGKPVPRSCHADQSS